MMRKTVKWSRRLLLGIVTLLAMLWLVQTLVLPRLVASQLTSRLRAQGLTPASVDVDHVSLTSTTLRNLHAGSGLSVRFVHVTYTPWDLLHARVADIVIQGATLRPAEFATLAVSPPSTPSPSPQPPSSPPFSHLTITNSTVELPSHSATVDLQADALDRRIVATLSAQTQGIDLRLKAQADPAFQVTDLTLDGTCDLTYLPTLLSQPDLTLEGQATFSTTAQITRAAQVTWTAPQIELAVAAPTLRFASRPQALQDLTVQLHASAKGEGSTVNAQLLDGSFVSAGQLTTGMPKLPSLPASIRFKPTSFSLTGADWRLQTDGIALSAGDVQLNLESGRYGVRNGQAHGIIRSHLDLATLGKSHLLRTLIPTLAKMDLGGTLRMDLTRTEEAGRRFMSLDTRIENGKIASSEYQLSAEGIEGNLLLIDPSHPHTPSTQKLSLKYGQMGKWEVRDALVQLNLKDLNTLSVEKMQMGWLGGQVWCDPFDVALANGIIRSRVYGKELDLGKLIWVLSGEKAWGEGSVALDLPVTFAWPRMRFGDGFVEARPGGKLHLNYLADQLAIYLSAADPRFSTDTVYGAIRERMVQALRNFEFSQFRAGFGREGSTLQTAVSIRGKGAGEGGQELNLNVSVSDLDWAISRYLSLRR